MRKRLLSFVAVAAMTLTAMAQTWTAPVEPTSPAQGVDYEADGTTSYFLYNVGCGQFVTGANAWATEMSLGTGGTPYMQVVVEALDDADAESYPGCVKIKVNGTFRFYGGNGYENGRDMSNCYLFRNDANGFIDHNNQTSWYWLLTKIEGTNNYYWQSAPGMGFNDNKDQYAAGKGPGNPIAFNATIESDNIAWAFVPVGTVTEDDMAAYSAAMELYKARVELYNLLLEAAEYNVGCDAASTAYNNASATLEQIQAATDELAPRVTTAIVLAKIPESSEDNPLDITQYTIKNPNFDEGKSPWTITEGMGTNLQVQSATYDNGDVVIQGFIEAWRATGDGALSDGVICQTVAGLPAGRYRIEADVMAVWQGDPVDDQHGIYLFYNNGSYTVHSESLSTGNEDPEHFKFDFDFAGTATMTIGLMAESTNCNWMGMDNFRLYAIGECKDSPSWTALVVTYNTYLNYGDEVKAEYSKIEALQNALSDAEPLVSAASDNSKEAEYVAAIDKIDEARKAVDESAAAYKKLEAFVAQLDADQEKYTGDLQAMVEELYGQWQAAYEEGTATPAEIDAAIEAYAGQVKQKVQELFDAAVAAGGQLDEPLDITTLLETMDFPDGNGSGQETFSNGFPADAPVWIPRDESGNVKSEGNFKTNYGTAEVWNNRPFNISRDFTNLPKGNYTIKTHAFYRVEANDSNYPNYHSGAYDTGEEYAYLYAGVNHTPLINVAAIANPSFENLDNPVDCGDGNFVPNNQHSAYMIFSDKTYAEYAKMCEVSASGNVLEDGGTLRAGIVGTDLLQGNHWTIWYSFELYYNGISSLDEDILSLIDQLTNAETLNIPENLNVQTAALAAGNAALGEDIDTQTAAIKTLQEALAELAKTQVLYDELSALLAEYETLVPDLEVSPTATGFEDLVNEINNAISDETIESNAQIQNWINKIPSEWVKYVTSAAEMADASEDNAIDITAVIINANFDTAVSRGVTPPHWVADAKMGANQGYQDNNTYTNDEEGIALAQFLEAWNSGNAALADGQIYQTIAAALPEGYYRLSVDAHATNQGNEDVLDGVFVFVNGAGANNSACICTPNSTPQHFTVDFSANGSGLTTVGILVQSTECNWFAVDNFKLEFLGTTAPDAVATIEANVNAPATIYTIDGRQASQLRRGINIVRKGGNVNKVLVK